jgi:transposase
LKCFPSEGALAQYGPRVRAIGAYLVGYQHLPYERAVESDETSLRVAGAGAWVHSASTESLSLFYVHASRGHDAIAAAGVLPVFAGIAMHDAYTPYRRYGLAHALCNAHHLRELAGILDVDPDQTWADQMIRLLCEINDTARYARTAGAHTIDKRLLAVYRHRYQEIINAGRAANPSPAGHGARSPAAN